MWLELVIGFVLMYFLVRDGVCRGMLRAWEIKARNDAKAAQAALPPTPASPRPAAPPAAGSPRRA
jgi:hypothetical protein